MLFEDDDFLVEAEDALDVTESSPSLADSGSVDVAADEPDASPDDELSLEHFELLPLVLQLLVHHGDGADTLTTQMSDLRRRLAQCERLVNRTLEANNASQNVTDMTDYANRLDAMRRRYSQWHANEESASGQQD